MSMKFIILVFSGEKNDGFTSVILFYIIFWWIFATWPLNVLEDSGNFGFFLSVNSKKKMQMFLGKSPNFQNHKTHKYFSIYIFLIYFILLFFFFEWFRWNDDKGIFIYLGKIPTQINSIDFGTVGHASKLEVNY